MKIRIDVKKHVDRIGRKVAEIYVYVDGDLTGMIFRRDGSLRGVEGDCFEDNEVYYSSAKLYLQNDEEIEKIIQDIVDLYKKVKKENWDEKYYKEFEI